jgi:hypothetical protein
MQISTDLYSTTFSLFLHPVNLKLPVLFCAEIGRKDAGNIWYPRNEECCSKDIKEKQWRQKLKSDGYSFCTVTAD